MRKILVPVTAFATLMLALAIQLGASAKVGDAAPPFSLQDQDGKTISLADLKGKTVVLEWFNDGCPYVVRHYKEDTMDATAGKYKDKDVVWLAINSGAGTSSAGNKTAAEKLKVNHPILSDADGTVGQAYGAKKTPHMFIIDKSGKLAYAGGIDNDPEGDKGDKKVNYVDKALSELADGKSVSEPQTASYGCGVHYQK